MKKIYMVFLFLLLLTSVFSQSFTNLVFYTEDFPPFSFLSDKKIQGISVDVLYKLIEKSNVNRTDINLQLIPWARAYRYLQNTPMTCLFTTSRTPAREGLFYWVGPINTSKLVLIGKKLII